MTRIAHLSFTPFRNDSRVLKEMRAARRAWPADEVALFCVRPADLPACEQPEPGIVVTRLRVVTRGLPKSLAFQMVKFVEWGARAVAGIRAFRPDLIHCHSLTTLPIGVLAKWLTGAPLLYDCHELETEQSGESEGLRKSLSRWAERVLIRRADSVVVVSASIARWYRDAYVGTDPVVVRNIPELPLAADGQGGGGLRPRLGIPAADMVFVYLGKITAGRGIELLLETFAGAAAGRHLVVLGYGDLVPLVEAQAARHPNIHFHPAVPPGDIQRTIADADVGLVMTDATALSNVYGLGNKLFECLLAGLPVITNETHPEKADFVLSNQCGWVAAPDVEPLRAVIGAIDRPRIEALREKVTALRETTGWPMEAAVLTAEYRRLVERTL